MQKQTTLNTSALFISENYPQEKLAALNPWNYLFFYHNMGGFMHTRLQLIHTNNASSNFYVSEESIIFSFCQVDFSSLTNLLLPAEQRHPFFKACRVSGGERALSHRTESLVDSFDVQGGADIGFRQIIAGKVGFKGYWCPLSPVKKKSVYSLRSHHKSLVLSNDIPKILSNVKSIWESCNSPNFLLALHLYIEPKRCSVCVFKHSLMAKDSIKVMGGKDISIHCLL